MKCPRCGSENVQFATKTSGGGFSFTNSCCGYILLGPLGLLCGAIGSGIKTEEFWVCNNCGHHFSAGAGVQKMKTDLADKTTATETYLEYKVRLSRKGIARNSYLDAKNRYFEASEQYKAAKAHSKKLLKETKKDKSKDKEIRKCAKRIDGILDSVAAWLIILGAFLCAVLVPLGVTVIVIGGILWFSHGSRVKKSKQRLVEIYPAYKYASKAEDTAEMNLNIRKEIYDMVTFIEKYEERYGSN